MYGGKKLKLGKNNYFRHPQLKKIFSQFCVDCSKYSNQTLRLLLRKFLSLIYQSRRKIIAMVWVVRLIFLWFHNHFVSVTIYWHRHTYIQMEMKTLDLTDASLLTDNHIFRFFFICNEVEVRSYGNQKLRHRHSAPTMKYAICVAWPP